MQGKEVSGNLSRDNFKGRSGCKVCGGEEAGEWPGSQSPYFFSGSWAVGRVGRLPPRVVEDGAGVLFIANGRDLYFLQLLADMAYACTELLL